MIAIRNCLAVFASCLALAGCSGLLSSNEPPVRRFDLQPLIASAEHGPVVGGTLALRIRAIPGLDTDRLLTMGQDGSSNYLAGARWPDYLPEFATSLLQRGMAAGGFFSTVVAARMGARADCDLDLEIQRFHTRLGGDQQPLSVEVRMNGQVRCATAGAELSLDQSEPVHGARLADVVAAYQRAFDGISRSLYGQLSSLSPSP